MHVKKGSLGCLFCERRGLAVCDGSLGADGAELLTEFLDAASGVDDLVLAGEERVRFSGHLDLDERVVFAFVVDHLFGLDGRTGHEFEVAGEVVEHDFTVIWMGISFHYCLG